MSIFKPPAHGWVAKINGLHIPPKTMIDAGKEVYIECTTMCGNEKATGDFITRERMSVEEMVRRAQFASSIQHVTRRACKKCKDQYQHGTNAQERRFLFAEFPQLGPIVGMDMRGPYGAPLGTVNPEEVGDTNIDTLESFRKDQAAHNENMKDVMAEHLKKQAGRV